VRNTVLPCSSVSLDCCRAVTPSAPSVWLGCRCSRGPSGIVFEHVMGLLLIMIAVTHISVLNSPQLYSIDRCQAPHCWSHMRSSHMRRAYIIFVNHLANQRTCSLTKSSTACTQMPYLQCPYAMWLRCCPQPQPRHDRSAADQQDIDSRAGSHCCQACIKRPVCWTGPCLSELW